MPAPQSSCRHPSCLWPAAALAGVLSLATGPAAAQALLQAAPYRYDVEARPGWLETRPLYVRNAGRESLKVRLRIADFRMSDRGALDLLPSGTLPSSLAGLLEFAPRELTLAPGQRGVVRLEMMSPTHGPASRCGVILSEVTPADADGPLGLASAPPALGTTLFLTRAPRGVIRAELVAIDAHADADGKVAIEVRVRNRCDRHASCTGEVKLLDSAGAVAITGVLSDGVVLPGAARVLAWESPRGLRAGRYLATVAINVGVPEFLVGEKVVVVGRRGPHVASSPR